MTHTPHSNLSSDPVPTLCGKRGAEEEEEHNKTRDLTTTVKCQRDGGDIAFYISQIESKLHSGQFRKETKATIDGGLYTFIVPGMTRSTYPFSSSIRLAGYTEYSKKLGVHCISAWGRPATELEKEVHEARTPRAHPSGVGYVYMGVHYLKGDAWGPRGQFGPRYGSSFVGD